MTDIDVEAGIKAWYDRDFDGAWSNSGIATDRLTQIVDEDGAVREAPLMRALTWRELYERERANAHALATKAQLVADIDRCEHGRHHGDACGECGGPSLGNPMLRDGPVVLAYTMGGAAYVARQDLGHLRSEVRVSTPEVTAQYVLFEGYDNVAPLGPPEQALSPDARRTRRQHRLVDIGIHPLTHTTAHPERGTCGDCQWRVHNSRNFPKCGLPSAVGRMTHGAATDCRAWWPACDDHAPFEPGQIRCRRCEQVGPARSGSKTICESCSKETT